MPKTLTPSATPVESSEKVEMQYRILLTLGSALKVFFSDDPRRSLVDTRQKWYWAFVALWVVITLASAVMLSAYFTPYVSPFEMLWYQRLHDLFFPERDYRMLAELASYELGIALVVLVTCLYCAFKLRDKSKDSIEMGLNLMIPCVIVSVVAFIVLVLSVEVIEHLLLKVNVFFNAISWIGTLGALVLPVLVALNIQKFFARVGYQRRYPLFHSWILASITIAGCMYGTLFVDQHISTWSKDRWAQTTGARHTPIGAVAHVCDIASGKVVCTLTLWPIRAQDAQLIGAWDMHSIDDKGSVLKTYVWTPSHPEHQLIPAIDAEFTKETEVEISIPYDDLCNNHHLRDAKLEPFYGVKGHFLHDRSPFVNIFRVQVAAEEPKFLERLEQVCAANI